MQTRSRSRNWIARIVLTLVQRRHLHYLCTAIGVTFLVPALNFAELPMKWDWGTLVSEYATIAARSTIAAVILHALQYPAVAVKFLRSIRHSPIRMLLILLYAAGLMLMATANQALLAVLLAIAIMGLIDTTRERGLNISRQILSMLPSAGYFFFGLILVFSFVNVIVRVRYYGLYCTFFDNIDKALIGGSVAMIAEHLSDLKQVLYPALNFIYFSMFAQIGGALIICSLTSGPRESLQLVGTILFAYYLAIILFFSVPSIGPFLHAGHLKDRMQDVLSFDMQRYLLANAQYLWEQRPISVLPTGYYIGFPCMHIAQPAIALWYLRRWKRVAALLLVYDLLLVAAILMLEWHYLIDIVGGVAVAALAIFIIGSGSKEGEKVTAVGEQ